VNGGFHLHVEVPRKNTSVSPAANGLSEFMTNARKLGDIKKKTPFHYWYIQHIKYMERMKGYKQPRYLVIIDKKESNNR
jgi:hypothetical protein